MTSEPVELAPVESAGQDVALSHLSESRQAVIRVLKELGEATVDELSDGLGVTLAAVRQQLAPLENTGLVAHRDERHGRGRPRRWYCLTPSAETLFPKRYGQLTNQLLGFVEESDPALVDAVFRRRQEQRTERALARLDGRGFDDRVRELTAILDDDGYLADCQRLGRGHWRVVEHNCAILDVAQRYGLACQTELSFLREVLPDAEVERVAHRLAGGHICAYDIRQTR
ncbi:MAG: ArsR family transcriptional regulator [Acidimicrobiaceae bacterium]|nr:ArsR family transcriptional regulator [Acidimicrobiaceae bacterium]